MTQRGKNKMKDKALKTDEKPKWAEDVCEEQNVNDCEFFEAANDSPVVESYNNGLVPNDTDQAADQAGEAVQGSNGKKYVWVGEYMTMTKILFKNYRLFMYSFLNKELRSDRLRYFAGFKALNRVINRDVCEFGSVTFWRIDREEFLADVEVTLKLEKSAGEIMRLKGFLVLWFDLTGEWKCTVESLEQKIPDREGLTMLSPYLIPYYKSHDMDAASEEIWNKYLPEALTDREYRKPEALAEKMGLKVMHCPLFRERTTESILFFKEGCLYTADESDPYNKNCLSDDEKKGSLVNIPAGTIVINSQRVKREYSYFNIYHECFHNEIHYLFFRLQEMGNNNAYEIEMKKIEVDDDHPVNDPLYWAEKQANRGAYGLMMPATETAHLIRTEIDKVESFSHRGSLYSQAGKALSAEVKMPYFRIRARMIQLGHIHARGALNFIKKVELRPFDFNTDSWRCDSHTFIIDELTMQELKKRDNELKELMDSGRYVFADGHVVRNDPRFVEKNIRGELMLSAWAERNVDQCCLRFKRSYEQRNAGIYVYGRMNFDAEYVKQTAFYLSDIIEEEKLDELDAKEEYIHTFPKDFKKAVEMLRKKKNVTLEDVSEYLDMELSTLSRRMSNPKLYRDKDFLVLLCLILELPDWISKMVFKRAGMILDEDDRRDRALMYILRAQSGDGIDAANTYLKKMKLPALSV